ncbi:MAG: preQ(1) synthase [Candidatus Omnitrophota bacterium]
MKKTYEGLQTKIRSLKTPKIDVWKNQYADREYTIHLSIPEFTCICPKTGLPDFATVNIEYSPAKTCLELKSLKLYIVFYRNVGIFHEHFVNKILDDIVKACQPRWAKVEAAVNSRGGIQTTVKAQYP